jgi:hypothetical protein
MEGSYQNRKLGGSCYEDIVRGGLATKEGLINHHLGTVRNLLTFAQNYQNVLLNIATKYRLEQLSAGVTCHGSVATPR